LTAGGFHDNLNIVQVRRAAVPGPEPTKIFFRVTTYASIKQPPDALLKSAFLGGYFIGRARGDIWRIRITRVSFDDHY
jgi:hypothetical protein